MTLPVRGRELIVLVTLLSGLMLSACGSDGSDPDLDIGSTKPAADTDVKAITALYDQYWDLTIQSENSATVDENTFKGVLVGPRLERFGRKIDNYRKQNLKRVGEPAVTDVEVTVTGDTAKILACLNEDKWRAEIDGKLIPPPEVLGNVGTGATAERRDGTWILTDLGGGDNDRCD